MRKIFKKSLACVLAAAMSVSLFVASFAVSAETADANITVSVADEINADTTSIAANVNIALADGTTAADHIGAALVTLNVSDNLAAGNVTVTYPDYVLDTDKYTVVDGNTIKILFLAIPADGEEDGAIYTAHDVAIAIDGLTLEAGAEVAISVADYQVAHAGTASIVDGVVSLTGTEGLIENVAVADFAGTVASVEEPEVIDFVYSNPVYTVANSKLVIQRSAPGAEIMNALKAGTAAGNRAVNLICLIDDKEFVLNGKITDGTGYMEVEGFALSHLSANISIYFRITADGGFLYESNAYEIVLADFLAESEDADAANFLALYEASKTADPIAVENTAEAGADFTYSNITYTPANSKLVITRSAPGAEIMNALKAGTAAGNRAVNLICVIDDKEFVLNGKITDGTGYMEVEGFALSHFTKNVSVYFRITADGDFLYESNAVNINLDAAITASTGAFADAYAALK